MRFYINKKINYFTDNEDILKIIEETRVILNRTIIKINKEIDRLTSELNLVTEKNSENVNLVVSLINDRISFNESKMKACEDLKIRLRRIENPDEVKQFARLCVVYTGYNPNWMDLL